MNRFIVYGHLRLSRFASHFKIDRQSSRLQLVISVHPLDRCHSPPPPSQIEHPTHHPIIPVLIIKRVGVFIDSLPPRAE